MRKDAVWSNEYGCYVAPVFTRAAPDPLIKYPYLPYCTIVITELGYTYLELKHKRLREITHAEYMEYKDLVYDIVGKEYFI